MIKILKHSLLLPALVCMFPFVSFAQSSTYVVPTINELGITVSPDYPGPNEEVSVNLNLYSENLNNASISWYQDGKSVLSGKGKTSYRFKTEAAGESTKIEIVVQLMNGSAISKNFTITPAGVDMVWEANSYTPPFYKGKALHTMQGVIKVVAMPQFFKNGRQIPSQNLIYEWSGDNRVYDVQSGYGKNVLVLGGSVLGRPENIGVKVTDPINNLIATGYITITPNEPQVVFYENDPYYGFNFEQALNGYFDLKGEEVKIVAAPYFFTNELGNALKFSWRLNGKSVPELSNINTAIFRKPEGDNGQSVIALDLENSNRVLQQASESLTIRFGE